MSDYNELLEMVSTPDFSAKDVYSEIMDREGTVLKAMDRYVEAHASKELSKTDPGRMSIADHYFKFIRTLRNIAIESAALKDIRDLPFVFLDGDRKVYIGALIVLVALVLFMAGMSE
jgi:hypothetical protein